jgi:hypothetical protein
VCLDFSVVHLTALNNFRRVKEIGPDIGGSWKFAGGCKANDGRIFFVPRNDTNVLVLDPADGTINLLPTPYSKTLGSDAKLYVSS